MHPKSLKMCTKHPYILKLTILVLFAWLFMSTTALAAEQYLCVPDKTTGFSFNKVTKKWQYSNFENETKYVISKSNVKDYVFQVTEVGENSPIARCESDFNNYGILFCSGYYEFKINKKNGRYLKVYVYGYYNVVLEEGKNIDEGGDTPHIEIGKCSPF